MAMPPLLRGACRYAPALDRERPVRSDGSGEPLLRSARGDPGKHLRFAENV